MAYYKWQHADILKEARWLVMQMPPVKKKDKKKQKLQRIFLVCGLAYCEEGGLCLKKETMA